MSPAYICIFDLQSGAKVVVSSNFCKTQFVCKSIDALCCLILVIMVTIFSAGPI